MHRTVHLLQVLPKLHFELGTLSCTYAQTYAYVSRHAVMSSPAWQHIVFTHIVKVKQSKPRTRNARQQSFEGQHTHGAMGGLVCQVEGQMMGGGET